MLNLVSLSSSRKSKYWLPWYHTDWHHMVRQTEQVSLYCYIFFLHWEPLTDSHHQFAKIIEIICMRSHFFMKSKWTLPGYYLVCHLNAALGWEIVGALLKCKYTTIYSKLLFTFTHYFPCTFTHVETCPKTDLPRILAQGISSYEFVKKQKVCHISMIATFAQLISLKGAWLFTLSQLWMEYSGPLLI